MAGPKSTQTRVVGITNGQDASLHTFSLLHLTFKQQNFFESTNSMIQPPGLFLDHNSVILTEQERYTYTD